MPTLIAATDRLTEQVKGFRDDVQGFRDDVKLLRRKHWWQVGLTIVLALTVFWQWSSQIEQERDTKRARVASCHQYNQQQEVQIQAEVTQSHDLVAALARGIKDPAERKRQVDAYNKTHDEIIADGHPLRDCSSAGIAAYLNQK